MGFWKVVASIGKGLAEQAEKNANEFRAIKMSLEEKDSETLKKMIKDDSFFGASSTKKSIAIKILKERGDYRNEDF